MSLIGILKGVVGLGPGIEGCKRDAAAGNPNAQFALGGFYERGQMGLSQNYEESAKWYRKAAEQGHAGALLYYGIYLAQGRGVEQDLLGAYAMVELAKCGNAMDKTAATEAQERIASLLTNDQIAEAERMASQFKVKRFGSWGST